MLEVLRAEWDTPAAWGAGVFDADPTPGGPVVDDEELTMRARALVSGVLG